MLIRLDRLAKPTKAGKKLALFPNQSLNDDGDREKPPHVKFNLAKVHYCKLKSTID